MKLPPIQDRSSNIAAWLSIIAILAIYSSLAKAKKAKAYFLGEGQDSSETLFGIYDQLMVELQREDPASFKAAQAAFKKNGGSMTISKDKGNIKSAIDWLIE